MTARAALPSARGRAAPRGANPAASAPLGSVALASRC